MAKGRGIEWRGQTNERRKRLDIPQTSHVYSFIHRLPSTVNCILSTVCCLLSVVCCLLSAVYCLLSAVCHNTYHHVTLQQGTGGVGGQHQPHPLGPRLHTEHVHALGHEGCGRLLRGVQVHDARFELFKGQQICTTTHDSQQPKDMRAVSSEQ